MMVMVGCWCNFYVHLLWSLRGCCPVIALLTVGDLHCWWSPPWSDYIPQLFLSSFSSGVVRLTAGGGGLSWYSLLEIGLLHPNSLKFLHRSQYGLYTMLWLWSVLVKSVPLDLFYREKKSRQSRNSWQLFLFSRFCSCNNCVFGRWGYPWMANDRQRCLWTMRLGSWTYSCCCMLMGSLWVWVFSGSNSWININTFSSFRCPSYSQTHASLWSFLG